MAKKLKLSSGKVFITEPALTVSDARTGEAIVVRGAGALASSGFKLKKGISLLKPIAKQALTQTGKLKVS